MIDTVNQYIVTVLEIYGFRSNKFIDMYGIHFSFPAGFFITSQYLIDTLWKWNLCGFGTV